VTTTDSPEFRASGKKTARPRTWRVLTDVNILRTDRAYHGNLLSFTQTRA